MTPIERGIVTTKGIIIMRGIVTIRGIITTRAGQQYDSTTDRRQDSRGIVASISCEMTGGVALEYMSTLGLVLGQPCSYVHVRASTRATLLICPR